MTINEEIEAAVIEYMIKRAGAASDCAAIVKMLKKEIGADVGFPATLQICNILESKGRIRKSAGERKSMFYIPTAAQLRAEERIKEESERNSKNMRSAYRFDQKMLWAIERTKEAMGGNSIP